MATTILSVSIPLEQSNFLESNPEISPSKIIQTKLLEIMNEQNRAETRIKAYEIRNARILSKLDKILRWCEDNKIIIPENVLE
jgi:hypothetical protein